MKKLTYAVPLTVLAAGVSVALATGSAGAAAPDVTAPVPDPHTVQVQIAPGVQYSGNTDDSSTVLSSPIGTVTTQGGAIQVADQQGRAVFGPQTFDRAPKAATTVPSGGTPAAPRQAEATAPVDAPAAPADRDADINTAVGVAATQFGLATGVGGLVGGVAGAAVGCVAGAATGGTLTTVASAGTLSVGGLIGGCLIGASTIGGVGTIVGGAALGVPVGIASAVQAYNTLHAQGDV